MSNQTEQQLRDLFAFDASRAPAADGLADAARRRVRQRRRMQAWTAEVGAVLVVAGVALSVGTGWLLPGVTTPPVVAAPGPTGVGALPDGGAASCVEDYSAPAVAGRAFAFDGTVVEVGPPHTNRAGGGPALAAVTFSVHQWFSGGSSDAVTVDMTAPNEGTGNAAPDEAGPAYAVGTRLLVSGEPRWGGAPLDDAIAWGCGFTRYYDEVTAASWADAAK